MSTAAKLRKMPQIIYLFSIEEMFHLQEKSHTCEEGGAHLRIFVWHLLMNSKNNYLFKKLLKWANKKCKNFNIYNVAFFKKK